MSCNIPVLIEEGDSLKVEAIDYLMVSVDDMAEELYSLRNVRLKLSGNRLLLAVNVKRYHPFNNGWAQIGRYGSGDVVPLERLLDKEIPIPAPQYFLNKNGFSTIQVEKYLQKEPILR